MVGKYFHEQTTKEIEKTFSINSTAPMHICNQFLKNMMEENTGYICNIASSASLVPNPKCQFMQQVNGRFFHGRKVCVWK